ncbi:Hypothetical Protein FCC1311_086392 [Hondaea fermentalgiana]|uniref:Uncharacterized protein n=1 Tax=Hondaea fermentalgiana TaxID=2315210 RepID=A0A2R5GWU9_9STRA|nr:Hypothetical Protein FCC1311_086392 [Hondaea fermentalgiana]|eukprot:GBG32414.1 Hypothetical Protein FCC1311_086392 [Hondaea fermentalgiana]
MESGGRAALQRALAKKRNLLKKKRKRDVEGAAPKAARGKLVAGPKTSSRTPARARASSSGGDADDDDDDDDDDAKAAGFSVEGGRPEPEAKRSADLQATSSRQKKVRRIKERVPRPAAASRDINYIQVQTLTRRGRNNMARPSVLLRLEKRDFAEQFRELFEEHVEGFTGLRGAKRERTAKEKNMEWRTRVEAKKTQAPASNAAKAQQERARLAVIERYRAMKKRQR